MPNTAQLMELVHEPKLWFASCLTCVIVLTWRVGLESSLVFDCWPSSAPFVLSVIYRRLSTSALILQQAPLTKLYNWGRWRRQLESKLKLRHQLGCTLLRQSIIYFNPAPWHPKTRLAHQECSRCSRLANPGLDTRENTERLKRKPKLFPTSLFIFHSLVTTTILFCPLSSNYSNHLTLFGFNLLLCLTCSTVAMAIMILAFWHKNSYLVLSPLNQ